MDYQIILLPRRDYWSWVRASKDYVLTYGPNLTPDPGTAANYMSPRQVITFPEVPGGYPENGDINRWFQTHHPGIRLDPIEVETPTDLHMVFQRRIEDQDRYGQRQRPFYLLWPTEYAVITQEFRANPNIYGRWGFPGHEGVDFRARNDTKIYCCADGEVYRVHTDQKTHPYGIHIRVRHQFGYKSVYAHLMKALVREGEQVQVGQVIGKADTTGASVGAHLHLTLKQDGATGRKETDYPKDIVDPTPLLVWPDNAYSKTFHVSHWPAGKCLIGAHGRIGERLEESDLNVIRTARLEAVKLTQNESQQTIEKIRDINPAIFIVARLTTDFSHGPVSPEKFLSIVAPDVQRLYRLGVRYFEMHANPNLQYAGWGRSWRGGEEFGFWFIEIVEHLRRRYPDAQYGFPGLSPGEYISGWRDDMEQFLIGAEDAMMFADWIGVNCTWSDSKSMKAILGGRLFEQYRARFPEKLLFITEFSNPSTDVDSSLKGRQYLDYYRMVREELGVGAVFAYSISASEGHDAIVWRESNGHPGEIASVIGNRSF